MRPPRRVAFLCFWLLLPWTLHAGEPTTPTWIYWGPSWEIRTDDPRSEATAAVSVRAVRRLARTHAAGWESDISSRPVPGAFLDHLRTSGIRIRVASRFLRAVSAELTAEQRAALLADPSVLRLEPVLRGVRSVAAPFAVPMFPRAPSGNTRPDGRAPARGAIGSSTPLDSLPDPRTLTQSDYGPSLDQLRQIGVYSLHQLGYSGRGVLVCMLDAGFDLGHDAFRSTHTVATWDFVGGDGNVGYEPGDTLDPYDVPGMDVHGTYTWSTLAGFAPGHLIGPAYRADYALARTEIFTVELRIEEDHYVRGLEWADSLGADVVSSSLGYLTFDDGSGYTPDQLDGRTAKTTRAVAWLIRRGVVVVTAAGNEGNAGLVTPADAESVITVGAVDAEGAVTSFSSRGPTADGRTKPDLCALGLSTVCASASAPSAYGSASGTSLATPLMAGLAALLVEAHPDWTPMQVLQSLRQSADQASRPDNARGWGVPDGLAAAFPGNLQVDRILWQDAAPVGSAPASDSTASPGEAGEIGLILHNAGMVPSDSAWVRLRSGSDLVVVDPDSLRAPPVPTGGTVHLTGTIGVHLSAELAAPGKLSLLVGIRGDHGSLVYYREVLLSVTPIGFVLRLIPNPLTRGAKLGLDLSLPPDDPVEVRLLDPSGQSVGTYHALAGIPVGARRQWFDLPNGISNGVYFARMTVRGTSYTRKIVIAR